MDAQVADMEAVRAKFGFQKFDLVGDSYGGLLAMAYAAAHPEHVEKLILSDSAAPAWKDIVRVLPDVYPDVLEQIAAREKNAASRHRCGRSADSRSLSDALLQRGESRCLSGGRRRTSGRVPQVSRCSAEGDQNAGPHAGVAEVQVSHYGHHRTIRHERHSADCVEHLQGDSRSKVCRVREERASASYEEPDKYVKVVDAFLSEP